MSQDNTVLATIFQGQLTAQGLADLRHNYPADQVPDMTVETNFKQGRKVRTEQNKLTKAINDRRIEIGNQIKAHADNLISDIQDIYAPYVSAFEVEDKRRKEEAERIKRELEEKLAAERVKISQISSMIDSAIGANIETIDAIIEAVDMIEVESFDKELIHEAITAKKETLDRLTQLRIEAVTKQQLDAERSKMEIEKRINNLRMIPTEMMMSTSVEIEAKIASLQNYEPKEYEFKERLAETLQHKQDVINQLNMILTMAKQRESMAAQLQPQVEEVKPIEQATFDAPVIEQVAANSDCPLEEAQDQTASLGIQLLELTDDYQRWNFIFNNADKVELELGEEETAVKCLGFETTLDETIGNAPGVSVMLSVLGIKY